MNQLIDGSFICARPLDLCSAVMYILCIHFASVFGTLVALDYYFKDVRCWTNNPHIGWGALWVPPHWKSRSYRRLVDGWCSTNPITALSWQGRLLGGTGQCTFAVVLQTPGSLGFGHWQHVQMVIRMVPGQECVLFFCRYFILVFNPCSFPLLFVDVCSDISSNCLPVQTFCSLYLFLVLFPHPISLFFILSFHFLTSSPYLYGLLFSFLISIFFPSYPV